MEIKIVSKLFYIICVALFTNNTFAQNKAAKYLLFNNLKDSLIVKNNTKYYKIDGNLFDISRYNEIDTINLNKFRKIKLTSVKELWQIGQGTNKKIKYGEPILVLDTYNRLFKNIYILEKINNTCYKRTRVWWVDY